MAFDWLIKTEYFVIFHRNSNFWAWVSQDSRSCDEVITLVRLQVNPPVRTAGPVMFHNDCDCDFLIIFILLKEKINEHSLSGTYQCI